MQSSELTSYHQQLRLIDEDARRLTADLTTAQFNWRSQPGQWSIAECLQHLNAVNGSDLPLLSEAMAVGRAKGRLGQGPFRYGWLGTYFVNSMEPPIRRRFRAPKTYLPPTAEQQLEPVLTEFFAVHARLAELIGQSDGLDLAKVRTATPVSKWIRFSLGQRFAALLAHDRRHLWQAWQVRRSNSFPH